MFFSFGTSCLDPTSPTICPFSSFGPGITEQLVLRFFPSPLLQISSASFLLSYFLYFLMHLLSFSIFLFSASIFSQSLFPGTNLTVGCLVGHFKKGTESLFFFFTSLFLFRFRDLQTRTLAVHKHKHEMTLKFGPARTDSVIIMSICCPRSHVP